MYHRADFIQSDPVQFPHRYTLKQDIEVSGLLTAIMSFGNRKQILKKADELHGLMGDSPYQYVLSCQWEKDFPSGATNSFYRMLSYADFYGYFRYTAPGRGRVDGRDGGGDDGRHGRSENAD